jgi:hypothetical protein
MDDPVQYLELVNANNFAVLYKCRCSSEESASVVPKLIALLRHDAPGIRQEALRALHRIGPTASSAAPAVADVWAAGDILTRRLAVLTLGRLALIANMAHSQSRFAIGFADESCFRWSSRLNLVAHPIYNSGTQ